MSNGLHRSDLPEPVRTILAKGAVIPAHPLALDPSRAVRPRLAAGADALLHRCRRRRACGRRARDAVRDPRGRALPPGAGARRRDRRGLDRTAARHDRRRDRQDRAGRRGGAHGAIARLSRRAAVARRHEGRQRGRARSSIARAVAARDAADRLLPADGGRRHSRCRAPSGPALPPSTTSSPSRSRRSTATSTLDVAFGVAAAGAEDRVTLYTGNDDHIVADLVTPLAVRTADREVDAALQGRPARPLERVGEAARSRCSSSSTARSRPAPIPPEILALDGFVTDCNSVVFDVANDFAGCIPGCHEILRRQGLMTLDPLPRSRRDA